MHLLQHCQVLLHYPFNHILVFLLHMHYMRASLDVEHITFLDIIDLLTPYLLEGLLDSLLVLRFKRLITVGVEGSFLAEQIFSEQHIVPAVNKAFKDLGPCPITSDR